MGFRDARIFNGACAVNRYSLHARRGRLSQAATPPRFENIFLCESEAGRIASATTSESGTHAGEVKKGTASTDGRRPDGLLKRTNKNGSNQHRRAGVRNGN